MPNGKSTELSERELDILKLVATGASNKEIAQQLFISLNTVKVHLRNIFAKIGVTSRTEAAMYAVRIGLVESISPQIAQKEETGAQAVKENNRLVYTYVGVIGGFLLVLLIAGFVTKWGNVFSPTPTISPTSTPRVQWFQLAGLTTPRWDLAVANFENQIYAIGGETATGVSGSIEMYDPSSNMWKNLAEKPTPVSEANAAVIGGLIYIPGGKLASGLPTNVNEIYDPGTNHWTTGSSMPKALSAYAMTVYEGLIYIFGGWDGSQIVNDAYVYDYRTDSWSAISPLPTARAYAGAVVVGGKIYVIGGWDGKQALTANEVFRPDDSIESSAWSQAPALPSGRYGMGITNLADIIFVLGGIGAENDLMTIALSPGDKDWGQLESPLPSGLSYPGAVTVGTRLYVLGGKTSNGGSDQVWSYQVIFTITLPIIR
jgi:DNA-binding CsgD family transcriptional regulator